MGIRKIMLAATLVGALAACGQTFGEQALIGAGGGAATGVVTGGSAATGALVGAAANVAYCQRFPGRCN